MKKQIIFILVLILGGCIVNSDDLFGFIIGKWETGERDSEWGIVNVRITFTENNTFKIENILKENPAKPLTIEGDFKLVGSHLIASSWNDGEPINIIKKNEILVLEIDDEPSIIVHRLK